jgi:hypothetical protein
MLFSWLRIPLLGYCRYLIITGILHYQQGSKAPLKQKLILVKASYSAFYLLRLL